MIRIDTKLMHKHLNRLSKMFDRAKPDHEMIQRIIQAECERIVKEAMGYKYSFGCVLCESPHKAPASSMCSPCLQFIKGLGKRPRGLTPRLAKNRI